jgi:hypothetical protein
MDEVALPPSELWAMAPARAQAPLREQVAALHAENRALQAGIRDLKAQLGHDSSNTSRLLFSDPPPAPVRAKVLHSGRKRGEQPGHGGAPRRLLAVKQVDPIVAVVQTHHRRYQQAFPRPELEVVAGPGGIRRWS